MLQVGLRDILFLSMAAFSLRLGDIDKHIIGDPAASASVLVTPVLAALNAFATLVTDCTIEVEKVSNKRKKRT